MGKDHLTEVTNSSNHSEKISEFLKKLELDVEAVRELFGDYDPITPAYEWLCGVKDGVSLLISELWQFLALEKKVGLADLREEVESIADSMMHCVRRQIEVLYTVKRLPGFQWSRDNWKRIKQLG